MATPEERIKILKMIQEGKISAEDGVQLLEALSNADADAAAAGAGAAGAGTAGAGTAGAGTGNASKRAPGAVVPPAPPYSTPRAAPAVPGSRTSRWLRVLVTDTKTGRTRVNVRLPVSMVNAGIKLGARFAPEVQGLDTEKLMEHLNAGDVGKIVDVYDDEDGEHVEVFIE